jgi:hypothetical protein
MTQTPELRRTWAINQMLMAYRQRASRTHYTALPTGRMAFSMSAPPAWSWSELSASATSCTPTTYLETGGSRMRRTCLHDADRGRRPHGSPLRGALR